MLHKPRARALAALALLTAMALFAAAASLHHHDNSARDACRLCQAGHLPALQCGSVVAAPSLDLVAWHIAPNAFHPQLDPVLGTGSSRAPPSA
jgi:hypothetical protein